MNSSTGALRTESLRVGATALDFSPVTVLLSCRLPMGEGLVTRHATDLLPGTIDVLILRRERVADLETMIAAIQRVLRTA